VPLVATEAMLEAPPVPLLLPLLLADPVGVGFDPSPDGRSEHRTKRIAPPRTLKIVNRDVMARIRFGQTGCATPAYGTQAVR
jgi:hypothetical protein